jgi:uncharacterized membrane protein YeaQ/YmgE (transglycosylase-associated protein family)
MGFFLFLILAVLAVIVLGSLLHLTVEIIVALIIWMLAGMIAGWLLRGRGYGPVGDVLLGLVGGFVGSFVLRALGMSWVGGIWGIGSILVGVIGAVLFVYLIRVLGKQDFAG